MNYQRTSQAFSSNNNTPPVDIIDLATKGWETRRGAAVQVVKFSENLPTHRFMELMTAQFVNPQDIRGEFKCRASRISQDYGCSYNHTTKLFRKCFEAGLLDDSPRYRTSYWDSERGGYNRILKLTEKAARIHENALMISDPGYLVDESECVTLQPIQMDGRALDLPTDAVFLEKNEKYYLDNMMRGGLGGFPPFSSSEAGETPEPPHQVNKDEFFPPAGFEQELSEMVRGFSPLEEDETVQRVRKSKRSGKRKRIKPRKNTINAVVVVDEIFRGDNKKMLPKTLDLFNTKAQALINVAGVERVLEYLDKAYREDSYSYRRSHFIKNFDFALRDLKKEKGIKVEEVEPIPEVIPEPIAEAPEPQVVEEFTPMLVEPPRAFSLSQNFTEDQIKILRENGLKGDSIDESQFTYFKEHFQQGVIAH